MSELYLSESYLEWAHGPAAESGNTAATRLLELPVKRRKVAVNLADEELREELRQVAELWSDGRDCSCPAHYVRTARSILIACAEYAPEPASPWHEELDAVLMVLDDSPLECDGMTYAISYLLREAEIPHRAMIGAVEDTLTRDRVEPHCWIELADGWIVDLRLRMWLGDSDRIPHGVFERSRAFSVVYEGAEMKPHPAITRETLELMTEGRLSHAKVPQRDDP